MYWLFTLCVLIVICCHSTHMVFFILGDKTGGRTSRFTASRSLNVEYKTHIKYCRNHCLCFTHTGF